MKGKKVCENCGRSCDPKGPNPLPKLPHEFAFYPTGGHGYGRHCQGDAKAWPDDTLKWLRKVLPTLGK